MGKTTGETSSSTSHTSENYLTRERNVATVHKPEGIYTIIYGSHILPGKGKLPDKTDGAFLEGLEAGNSTEINRHLNDLILNNPGTQYKEFINLFKDRRIPVYSGDVNFESLISFPVEVLEEAAKTVIGIELLHKISKELKSKSGSRRSFLKGAAASLLVLPFIARTGRVISAQTNHFEK